MMLVYEIECTESNCGAVNSKMEWLCPINLDLMEIFITSIWVK